MRASGRRCAGNVAALFALGLNPSHAADAPNGETVFTSQCSACHQAGGVGAPGLAPPLASDQIASIAKKNPQYLVLVTLNGLSGNISLAEQGELNGIMPPAGASLSDDEVAAVVGYVALTLNATDTMISADTVRMLRDKKLSAKELRAMRQDLVKP